MAARGSNVGSGGRDVANTRMLAVPGARAWSRRLAACAAAVSVLGTWYALSAGAALARPNAGDASSLTAAADSVYSGESAASRSTPVAVLKLPQAAVTEFPIPTAGSAPYGIVIGADGNLWFTESKAGKIGRITPAGQITEFPIPAGYAYPSEITAGPDGNLWFVQDLPNASLGGTYAIGRITTTGDITEFPTPSVNGVFIAARDIASGPDGNVWFTDFDDSLIGRITPAGQFSEFPTPTAYSHPTGIVRQANGDLWFGERTGIGSITPAGQVTDFPVPTSNPEIDAITAGPDGNLWFTEDVGKIGRITPTGQITEFPVPNATAANGLYGIVAGSDGNMWFTDHFVGMIDEITPAGQVTEFAMPSATSHPFDITGGPAGTLWFTDESAGMIGRLDLAAINVPPATLISRVVVNARARSAAFTVTATGMATSLQCALVQIPRGSPARTPKPQYTTCSKTKRFTQLADGTYIFFARAVGPGGTDQTPATHKFQIK